jgi:hypothetical protein
MKMGAGRSFFDIACFAVVVVVYLSVVFVVVFLICGAHNFAQVSPRAP